MVQRTVCRVLKSFVELNDGSRWKHSGSVHPRQEYSLHYIRPMTPELESKIRRARLVRRLKDFAWDSLGDEVLAECARLADNDGLEPERLG
jgi:hypothetical protein